MLQNKTVRLVIGGVALLGASYLVYKFWTEYTKKKHQKNKKSSDISQDEPRLVTIASNYSEFYFDKEVQLHNIVSKFTEKGPSIEDLYLLSPNILVDQYVKYTKQIRKRRRLIRKVNEDQYVGLIRNYEFQIRELLMRGREEVLEECGRSVDDLERMQSAFEMFDDLQDLKKKAMQNLQEKAFPLAQMRHIPKPKLRLIIQEQINFISNHMHDRIKKKLQEADELAITQEQIFKIITTLIDDIIYEKYGYEREEIERQINQLPLLAKDLKKWRNALLTEIGEVNFQSLESPEGSDDEGEEDKNTQSVSAKTQILDDSINEDK